MLVPAGDIDQRSATVDGELTAQLRAATRDRHQSAESSSFITELIAGELDCQAYIDLLAQYRVIYRELEAAEPFLAADPIGAGLVVDGLARLTAIEADLSGLAGDNWQSTVVVVPATHAYAERLRRIVAERWVGGYVAHAYTRYLGDLAGGQVIRQAAQRHYGVAPAQLAFATFDRAGGVKRLRDDYRARLNALSFSAGERASVADEACAAFDANSAVFADLAGLRAPKMSAQLLM